MSSTERDPKVTHKIMSAIPSKDTEPELMLRKALWKENLRYRVNYKNCRESQISFLRSIMLLYSVMGTTGMGTIGLSVVWVRWKRNLLAILTSGRRKYYEILNEIEKSMKS